MTIQVQCEFCGASLKVKDKLAGTEGKCPKCQKVIHIPDSSSDDAILCDESPSSSKKSASKKSAEDAEEDAIFGDDFFNMDDQPVRPRTSTVVSADAVSEKPARKVKKSKPVASVASVDADADADAEVEGVGVGVGDGAGGEASNVASSLLSKTGRRNRPDDIRDSNAPAPTEYDYSEISYLLLHRILPAVTTAIVMFTFCYWLFEPLIGGGRDLPELADLTGRVTLNGEGVPARLDFLPVPGIGRTGSSGSGSVGVAGPDGIYEVTYRDDIKGLIIGTHEVRINTGKVRAIREITIVPGSNTFDFTLP